MSLPAPDIVVRATLATLALGAGAAVALGALALAWGRRRGRAPPGADEGPRAQMPALAVRPLPDLGAARAQRVRDAWELASMGTAASAATALTTASELWQHR